MKIVVRYEMMKMTVQNEIEASSFSELDQKIRKIFPFHSFSIICDNCEVTSENFSHFFYDRTLFTVRARV